MTMKLHFEPNLDYQLQAIEAVCDLFRGQEICRTEFTVSRRPVDPKVLQGDLGFEEPKHVQLHLGLSESALGIGNRLTLLDDELLKNLKDIQLRNGLPPSGSLASGDFTVEMETGTGKTYVYLRTIFELNKRYGFTKFVIVVLVEHEGQERLYFVVESKGVPLFVDVLRPIEQAKIDCGREHFKALETGVEFAVAKDFEAFSESIDRAARQTKVPVSKAPPFRQVTPREEDKYRTCIPLLTLKAAAGSFVEGRLVEELDGAQEWVEPLTRHRLGRGMFVAQVIGKSMEPAIQDQDHCLFRTYDGGTRQDRVVLTMLRDQRDPETGAAFTVKRYVRKGERVDGKEQVIEIELQSRNRAVPNIKLHVCDENELKTIAWFLETLPALPE